MRETTEHNPFPIHTEQGAAFRGFKEIGLIFFPPLIYRNSIPLLTFYANCFPIFHMAFRVCTYLRISSRHRR